MKRVKKQFLNDHEFNPPKNYDITTIGGSKYYVTCKKTTNSARTCHGPKPSATEPITSLASKVSTKKLKLKPN